MHRLPVGVDAGLAIDLLLVKSGRGDGWFSAQLGHSASGGWSSKQSKQNSDSITESSYKSVELTKNSGNHEKGYFE